MKGIRLAAAFGAAFLLAGCQTPEQIAEIMAIAPRPVTCDGSDECGVKWSKAVRWLHTNSAYDIRTETDTLVTTTTPPGGPYLDFWNYSLQKVAEGGGKFRIDLLTDCPNNPCHPSEIVTRADFYRTVTTP